MIAHVVNQPPGRSGRSSATPLLKLTLVLGAGGGLFGDAQDDFSSRVVG